MMDVAMKGDFFLKKLQATELTLLGIAVWKNYFEISKNSAKKFSQYFIFYEIITVF